MESKTLELFKTLTEFPSIPGHERELRAWVKERISGYTDEIVQDRLGSLFGVLRGQESGPRVMVAGHLDEVGFIVNGITENGMIRFQPVGGCGAKPSCHNVFKY
ncbi:putative aminopeptidase YsdC [compost metagenome]